MTAQGFRPLERIIDVYLPSQQVEKVRAAYLFSEQAHAGQSRLSGDPYISHPLEVGCILGEMHMDYQTLCAAMLHDVLEDTEVQKDEICHRFGKEIAELVDGVTKLERIRFDNYAQAQAGNLLKMLMVMSRDIRVILVKLADRLHNMLTIQALPDEKRRRIARETLQLYAPVAQRLGINGLRLQLEDLGFGALYPLRYKVLRDRIKKRRGGRRSVVGRIKRVIDERLKQEGIEATIIGREKHLYGIYKKMQHRHLSFDEVSDVHAFRIVTQSINDCYLTLGAIHNLYKPVPGKFKDYIAIPKSNGYQSLHTVLFGPRSLPLEVQIRTESMDRIADAGIAAHWLYKSQEERDQHGVHQQTRQWLREVLELHKAAGDPEEFLEHVRVDLLPDEVYLFTPKGEIVKLPSGATVIDMAYAIHTDIGNRCTGAVVEGQPVPLSTRLESGQTVKILTSPMGEPSPAWLDFVVTARARANVRQYLKHLKLGEARLLGKRLLEPQLRSRSISTEKFKEEHLEEILKKHGLESAEQLFEEVGLGNLSAPLIAREPSSAPGAEDAPETASESTDGRTLVIQGAEGMVVNFAKCCYPIPGDLILGHTSTGRGIVIHRETCKNRGDYRKNPEKWLHVEWGKKIERDFLAGIRLNVLNQQGTLATVAAAISEYKANIVNVGMSDNWDRNTTMNFEIEVHDRPHLARVMQGLRRIRQVTRIVRI